MPKKTTPAERFAAMFELWNDAAATDEERQTAKRKCDEWLKRNDKTWRDASAILAQAAADRAAGQPQPPPSDPRDANPNPFDDPQFTPAGLVEGIALKYLAMKPHVAVIYALWVCFTHVYTRFSIAPRIALTSEQPDSGKSTALEIARCLVLRPNDETAGTGAAIADFLNEGPCTVLYDELDQIDKEAQRRLQQIWDLGHRKGARTSKIVSGQRKLINLFAPMLAAGVGGFLAPQQQSRTFVLEMEPYTEATEPEWEWTTADEEDIANLNKVYSFLHHWAAQVKLNPKPVMPAGVLRRSADNVRGLLAIADNCGQEWGRRAREAVVFLLEKERAERPQITIIRHGLAIFDALQPELDQIKSTRFNQELKRLDLPDAKWTRYRGPSGTEYAHPLEMHEQAALLEKVGNKSARCRPPAGKQFRGYTRAQFEEAWTKHGSRTPDDGGSARGRLRLIGGSE
jgi:Protein of unknown function (DUF3631)